MTCDAWLLAGCPVGDEPVSLTDESGREWGVISCPGPIVCDNTECASLRAKLKAANAVVEAAIELLENLLAVPEEYRDDYKWHSPFDELQPLATALAAYGAARGGVVK